jgi:hypothetical protein
MLQISSKPIGTGKERACYIHPEDPRKAVKIPKGKIDEQTRRDIRFYRKLEKRALGEYLYIPRYYGVCETNLGKGIVVDLIRNYDGEISRPLNWYLAQNVPIEDFDAYLEELKQFFLQTLVIFNHDMHVGNLLFQRTSTRSARLVAIDGLGDVVAIDWLNRFPFLVRRKITRRWSRFIARVYVSSEVQRQRAAAEGNEP